MPHSSYWQHDFRGGEWSGYAANRIHDPRYKTAMAECLNFIPRVDGSLVRRPGFMYMAHTRRGAAAKILTFKFAASAPFELELTDGVARFFSGLGQVFHSDANVTLASFSSASPSVVTINGALPSGWADGDTVMFSFNGFPPTAPQLAGRQYEIGVLSTTTFSIRDAVTGESVDGSTISYTAPTYGTPDYVYKVYELATPYLSGEWATARLVSTPDTAYLLHGKYQPLAITYTNSVLELLQVSFTDGPYLDTNTTTTTITPSGTSGTVTLTASATTGINSGLGFQPTDIGRLIRLRGAPATWSGATTYAKDAKVTGSDGLIYTSVAGSNLNHDPTTDDGTYWQLAGDVVTWTYAQIATRTSTTAVTATILGANLPGTTAITAWRLGLYSGTTGWPTCGVFHEGRLWLGGAAPNRFDASNSNEPTNFAPTASDGTVADNHAISGVFNATESSQITWMLSSEKGLLCGSQSGEWLIRATAAGDPLAPSNVQVGRVSAYQSADQEPVQAVNTTVFTQARKRKILDHTQHPYSEVAGWYATNLTELADGLTIGGIEELAYAQEPFYQLWARRADGVLIGSTFHHGVEDAKSFNGWHEHALGGDRTVVSIAAGATFDGLSTTLYAVLLDPETGYHTVNGMAPMFDDALEDYEAVLTDGGAGPLITEKKAVASGDSFNGIRIHGLTYINGETIELFLGGLDVGSFTVASGYINVPYTTTFTEAFLNGLDDPDGYGVYTLPVSPKPTTYSSSSMLLYTDSEDSDYFVPDYARKECYGVDWSADTLVRYDLEAGTVIDTYTLADIFGAGVFWARGYVAGDTQGFTWGQPEFVSGAYYWVHPDGHIYMTVGEAGVGLRNSDPIVKINTETMKMVGSFGVWSNGTSNDLETGFVSMGSTACIRFKQKEGLYQNFLVCLGSVLDSQVGVLDCDRMVGTDTSTIASGANFLCAGFDGTNTAYGVSVASALITFYRFVVSPFGTLTQTTIDTIAPSEIDATWSAFENSTADGLMFDPTDGHVILFITSPAGPTNRRYWVKLNTSTGAVIWATASSASASPIPGYDMTRTQLLTNEFKYWSSNAIYTLETTTGTLTSSAYATTVVLGAIQIYLPAYKGVLLRMNYVYGSGTKPTYLNGASDSGNPNSSMCLISLQGPATAGVWPPGAKILVPGSIGALYTSRGQLMRPDTNPESGASTGPGVGKRRRNHRYTISLYRSRGIAIGTDFGNTLKTVPLTDDAGTATAAPTLFTGIVTDALVDDYSFDGQIAWQCTGAYPATIAGVGGRIETMDD